MFRWVGLYKGHSSIVRALWLTNSITVVTILNVLLMLACFSKILSRLWTSCLVYGFYGCKEPLQPPVLLSRGQNAFLPSKTQSHLGAGWKSHWAHRQPWAQWRVHGVCFSCLCGKIRFWESQILFCPCHRKSGNKPRNTNVVLKGRHSLLRHWMHGG